MEDSTHMRSQKANNMYFGTGMSSKTSPSRHDYPYYTGIGRVGRENKPIEGEISIPRKREDDS